MTDATTGFVTIERDGAVAVLTLDDPRRRNALSAAMITEIAAALDDLESDPEIQAVVITGAGSAFCAGAELATLERAAEGDFDLVRKVYGGFLRVLQSPLLIIGAINGPAVGAGFNLALACDVRIAGDSARFVPRFAELRIFPGGGHTWMLSRAVGHQQAVMALLLGQTWNAADAVRVGLAAEAVPTGEVVDRARALASGLNDLEPEYTRRLIETLRAVPDLAGHSEALELEAGHQEWSTRRAPFLDGLAKIKSSIAGR
jgi:enoyl-CoA hydratase